MSTDLMEPLTRLDRDLKQAARLMGRAEVRALVDLYYQVQEFRKAGANQERSAAEGEPRQVVGWVTENTTRLENNIKRALGEFVAEYRIGQWLTSITGIGPVISAGLMTHLDIRKARTAGQFWRFAGLDPTVVWGKGQKRPWNADLKRICFIAGDCFVKFQNHKDDYYGKLYVERKKYEILRNERGELADQAKASLEAKNYGKETEARKAYEDGKLPDARIHLRAIRWTSKMFLSHVHHAMHVDYYGVEPPVPYSFGMSGGNHSHFIPLPNWPWEGEGRGLRELLVDEEPKVEPLE